MLGCGRVRVQGFRGLRVERLGWLVSGLGEGALGVSGCYGVGVSGTRGCWGARVPLQGLQV